MNSKKLVRAKILIKDVFMELPGDDTEDQAYLNDAMSSIDAVRIKLEIEEKRKVRDGGK